MIDTKGIEIFIAIGIACNFSFKTLICQAHDMLRYFRLITRGTTKEVFKVELYETVRGIRMEEESFIGFRLTKGSNKALNGEIAIHEKSFNRWANIKLHEVTISENLLVGC